ncbi:MAG: sn-glycerol-3-phosphate ABC transporter ATP-binding protein UgpC [Proteobacteria bacterium]|nr:sn-glycerol-3-phosphate ABC transporter ATP-binding protein UgpC [Pseudomonadota bacterium]
MASVTLEKVRKVYDNGFVAVHGADIEVADGEFVVLVGPSGCGKSTTLRMIAGLESVTEGRLSIGDRVVNDVAAKDRDIAMVFQNYALYPHMSVFDNMAFGLRRRKLPKDAIRRRVDDASEILGIRAVLDRKPRQLSGGQSQRVAVGRAIVREPEVFLFDEPLSNLDAKLRVQMRTEITSLHQRLGATMIYVTHDQVEAMTMGDRIVVMHKGHVQQTDVPLSLYDRPANLFVAGFIGSPAMNFLHGEIPAGSGTVFRERNGAFDLEPLPAQRAALEAYAGSRVVLGVRPEDLYVADSRRLPDRTARLDAVVSRIEPMGNESFVYGSISEQPLIARVSPQALPGKGESIGLAVDLERLHFFDAGTERAIVNHDVRRSDRR